MMTPPNSNGTWLCTDLGVKSQAFWLLGSNPPNHGCLGLSRKASLSLLSPGPNLTRLFSLGFPVANGQSQGEMNHQFPHPHPWPMRTSLNVLCAYSWFYLLWHLC